MSQDKDIDAVNECLDQLSPGTRVKWADLVINVKRKLNEFRAAGQAWPYQSDNDLRGVCKDVAGTRKDVTILPRIGLEKV